MKRNKDYFGEIFFVVLVIIGIFLYVNAGHCQTAHKFDKDKVEVNVLSNVSSFYLDGDYKVFESPMGFGVIYNSLMLQPGFYLSPVFSEDNVDLSFIIHIGVLKKFGIGFGYGLWNRDKGLVEPRQNNSFFTLGIELLN